MKIRQPPTVEKNISRQPASAASTSAKATKPAPPAFSPGQTLSGRVLSTESDGRVILEINGRPVTAYSTVNLPVGEKVAFTVSRGGDTPWLTLKSESSAQLLFRLLATEAIGRVAEQLDPGLLAKFPALQSLPSPTLAALVSLFPQIQVTAVPSLDNLLLSLLAFNPAKQDKISLSDADQELLQLLSQLEKSAPQSTAELHAVRQLISLQQSVSAFNQQQAGDNLLIILPFFFAGKSGWGQWLVRPEKEGSAKRSQPETGLRFDFFFHLSRLGETQLSLLVRGNTLSGTFFLDEENKIDYFKARLHQLRDRLIGLGFELPVFSCRIKEKNNQLRLKELLEATTRISNLALIDLTA